MKKNYLKISITETGRSTLKDKPHIFNEFSRIFNNIDEVKEFIIDRYGKIPKNKVYVDQEDGSSKQIGYCHSFWNSDISHDSKSWYQTDWVEITEVSEESVLI